MQGTRDHRNDDTLDDSIQHLASIHENSTMARDRKASTSLSEAVDYMKGT